MSRFRVLAENPARQRIVTAARRHFFAHGFRGVTMDDLAQALGMSKKTLYAHFASKRALVQAVLLNKFADLQADLERITTDCRSDFLATLRELLVCLQHHTAEIQPPFVRDVQRDAPDLFQLVEVRRAALIERCFGKLFAAGRRAGMVRKDIPARLAIEVLLGATQAVMNPQTITRLGATPKAVYSAVITIILEGVLTPAGRSKP